MNNPINNTVFDTRDLIKYCSFLEDELISDFNSFSGEEKDSS